MATQGDAFQYSPIFGSLIEVYNNTHSRFRRFAVKFTLNFLICLIAGLFEKELYLTRKKYEEYDESLSDEEKKALANKLIEKSTKRRDNLYDLFIAIDGFAIPDYFWDTTKRLLQKNLDDWDDYVEDCTLATDMEFSDLIGKLHHAAQNNVLSDV